MRGLLLLLATTRAAALAPGVCALPAIRKSPGLLQSARTSGTQAIQRVQSRSTSGAPSRQSKREVLIAKGIAGAALLRVAASSQTAAISAFFAMAIVIVTPVLAVEAMLLAMLMVVIGAASYWPANLMVAALGAVGVGGALNGLLQSWERLQRRRDAKRAAAERRRPTAAPRPPTRREARPPAERLDDDGSASLVALLVGALTAAIVGALP